MQGEEQSFAVEYEVAHETNSMRIREGSSSLGSALGLISIFTEERSKFLVS